MEERAETEENKELRNKFNFEQNGFYDVVHFSDAHIGFSFKKDLRDDDTDHVSLIQFFIPNQIYNDTTIVKKPLYVSAVYGEKTGNGVKLRGFDPKKLSEPVDVEFRDEYFYDIQTKKLYRENREVDANAILKRVYEKHIKPTKKFGGFFLRLKFRFWRIWSKWFFWGVSKIFFATLFLISGDRYSYEFILEEERLNGKIVSSRMSGRIGWNREQKQQEGQEKEKEGKKINFFGNDVPQWPIVFYSFLHLFLWWMLIRYAALPDTVISVFTNSFLTVLYVIASFWIIETALPFGLKKIIKYTSTLSSKSAHKKITI